MKNTITIDAYQAAKIAGEILDSTSFGNTYIDAHSLWFDAMDAYIKSIFRSKDN